MCSRVILFACSKARSYLKIPEISLERGGVGERRCLVLSHTLLFALLSAVEFAYCFAGTLGAPFHVTLSSSFC